MATVGGKTKTERLSVLVNAASIKQLVYTAPSAGKTLLLLDRAKRQDVGNANIEVYLRSFDPISNSLDALTDRIIVSGTASGNAGTVLDIVGETSPINATFGVKDRIAEGRFILMLPGEQIRISVPQAFSNVGFSFATITQS